MPAGAMTARRAVLRKLAMPAVVILLAAGLGSVVPAPHAAADAAPLAGSPASPAGPASPVTAYVVNGGSGTVTPIATATNTAGPPIPVGSGPGAIAITPDGRTAYVIIGGSVTPIATATNTAGPPIPVGSAPDDLAITPDGKTAYVTDWTSDTVTPIATATNTVGPPIPVGVNPNGIAITPDGKTAYAEDWTSGTVTPIATATNTVGPPIPVGSGPDDLAITPDGSTAYVASINSGTVTPIATATNTAGPPILVGFDPFFIAITPDGKTAYVAKAGNSETVIPIATATNTVGPPIAAGAGAIAITPDGKTAYVANGLSDTVAPIATVTNTVGPPITVGSGPGAIAITPGTVSQGPAFTSGSSDTAAFRRAFTFTVAASGDPAPRITRTGRLPSGVSFADYGDGTATISGIPAKAAAGVYPLTLTARNKNGTATQAFTLTVTRAPAIRKIRAIRARVGAAMRLTVRATGYPAPALAESGPLPGGLFFTDNGDATAVIAGIPAAADSGGGRYPVTITATNTSGTATRHFTIVVLRRRRR